MLEYQMFAHQAANIAMFYLIEELCWVVSWADLIDKRRTAFKSFEFLPGKCCWSEWKIENNRIFSALKSGDHCSEIVLKYWKQRNAICYLFLIPVIPCLSSCPLSISAAPIWASTPMGTRVMHKHVVHSQKINQMLCVTLTLTIEFQNMNVLTNNVSTMCENSSPNNFTNIFQQGARCSLRNLMTRFFWSHLQITLQRTM